MRLVILVPSAAFLETAGARIRYARLARALSDLGIDLSLSSIDVFDAVNATCEIAVVSKCYDARALVVAATLSRRGTSVGFDLFDDYFSQESDSRLSRFRRWLRQMARLSDFALCSTLPLERVVRGYCPDVPVHIVNDAAPRFDQDRMVQLLGRKVAQARSDGVMRVCWFGIGDNPLFPVGLSDLEAFGGMLGDLARGGLPIELTVLTNPRALDSTGLARITTLPVPSRIEEWSEERECEQLDRSFLCFLPVNAQPFSAAKSLNRALTAITASCQVLSPGFPLYAPLEEWIYRDPTDLLCDWNEGRLRLSPASIDQFNRRISQIGSAEREAGLLAKFLCDVRNSRSERQAMGPIALVHGFGTTEMAHSAVHAAGGISVGTPFCTLPLNFDAYVMLEPSGATRLFVSDTWQSRLKRNWRKYSGTIQKVGRRAFFEVSSEPQRANIVADISASLPLQLAMYETAIEATSSAVSSAFGAITLLSEDSPFPLEPAV